MENCRLDIKSITFNMKRMPLLKCFELFLGQIWSFVKSQAKVNFIANAKDQSILKYSNWLFDSDLHLFRQKIIMAKCVSFLDLATVKGFINTFFFNHLKYCLSAARTIVWKISHIYVGLLKFKEKTSSFIC